MKKFSVDRIENDIAVLMDDNNTVEYDLSSLPFGVKEGDIITIDDDGKMYIDRAEALRRKKELFEKQNSLFNK